MCLCCGVNREGGVCLPDVIGRRLWGWLVLVGPELNTVAEGLFVHVIDCGSGRMWGNRNQLFTGIKNLVGCEGKFAKRSSDGGGI